MSHDVVILVPRRADHGPRDRLWSFARARWAEDHPHWPIFEGHHEVDEGPFNRAMAINRAAAAAGDWNVALIIDSDVFGDANAMRAAVGVARTGQPACAFDHRKHLTAKGTARVLDDGFRGNWNPLVKHDLTDSVSGAYAVNRDLWDLVGGFDELFVGWGWEDVAFRISTETMSRSTLAKIQGDLWHLWHPRSPENDTHQETFRANKERGQRYKDARFVRPAMEELLAEARGVRGVHAGPAGRLEGWTSTMPPILHRTVPEHPSDEAQTWWEQAKALHPGWLHMNWQDPILPTDLPLTSDLWEQCSSGAQKAGLIRLEVLWTYGGIYIDSDVEVYQVLTPLLGLEAFIGWEDNKVAPDAVMGARPGHPAIATCLEKACEAVRRGKGAWDSGPGVTTAVLPGRVDVLALPPGTFYPYHYTERERFGEDFTEAQPWVYGAHHWRHSWKGH